MYSRLQKVCVHKARATNFDIATRSTHPHWYTNNNIKMRSFGAEISANRNVGDELLLATRSSIISKHKAGVTNKDLAAKYSVH